jgi:uncharacterized protein (TIGR02757 family)
MTGLDLKAFLDTKVQQYNQPGFIENDPIVIPHAFSVKQDIEIMGFWAAVLAWGQRKTIINKCRDLVDLMDGAPYDFIRNHEESDLKVFLGFKHRTFNDTDALYFLHFFRYHYQRSDTLETAFKPSAKFAGGMEAILNHFRRYFFSITEDFPRRTQKHVSAPSQKSSCKRINMFMRWMVRNDKNGVDFGIWKSISPAELICPIDLHVERVARKLGLIERQQLDWLTATELTENLKQFDPQDPVKYDFALFGLGIEEGF